MNPLTAALLGFVVLALGLAAFAAVAAGRRAMREDGRLRLDEIMRRRGASLPAPLTEAAAHDAALAARRCVTCGSKALCDELLRTGGCEGYAVFCPNAHYVERLRNISLAFL